LLIRQEKKLKRGEYMICSKIGSECPHPVVRDNHLVFVMMPFAGFDNVYYAIQTAVEGIEGKNFRCLRADDKFTTFQIWCRNICKNIRKAKYLVVDTTERNPNVFYELGFSHALESTRAILITQNVEDAPFDISDLNHIELNPYDVNAFGNLTEFYIITGNYKSALKTINTALALSLKKEEKAISLYLECLTKKLLDMDISASEKEFTKILKQDFETRWSFELIESWLATSKIEKGKKAFIIKKTEQLKKHKV
jgi:hypothetical protein